MTLKDHLKMMGRLVSEETIYNLNEELNKIKKPFDVVESCASIQKIECF